VHTIRGPNVSTGASSDHVRRAGSVAASPAHAAARAPLLRRRDLNLHLLLRPLSDDGNTAIMGGRTGNSNAGAGWVYIRSGGGWSQQGGKLVGNDAVGKAFQGYSVSLSADGNTAAVGGPFDNTNIGAGWIYVRSGGVWTQQGGKLVGTGAVGQSFQGSSIALSGAGNTAFMGGPLDDTNIGAAWVFTRNGGVWTSKAASWSALALLEAPSKVSSRCPPMATPLWWAG
jgi:hypothetical protein